MKPSLRVPNLLTCLGMIYHVQRFHDVWMTRTPTENDGVLYFSLGWRDLRPSSLGPSFPYEIRAFLTNFISTKGALGRPVTNDDHPSHPSPRRQKMTLFPRANRVKRKTSTTLGIIWNAMLYFGQFQIVCNLWRVWLSKDFSKRKTLPPNNKKTYLGEKTGKWLAPKFPFEIFH